MTREEKAIKIAEYEGWESTGYCDLFAEYPSPFAKVIAIESYYKIDNKKYQSDLEEEYSSFNGLMEIVERVNKDYDTEDVFVIHHNKVISGSIKNRYQGDFYYDVESLHLIDALQDAILFYYENRDWISNEEGLYLKTECKDFKSIERR